MARNCTPAARSSSTVRRMSFVANARCCTPGTAVELQVLVDLRALACPTAGSFSGNFTRWLPFATTLLISAEYSVAMSSPTNSAMFVKPMIRW